VVYSTTLERWQTRKGLESSNLSASALEIRFYFVSEKGRGLRLTARSSDRLFEGSNPSPSVMNVVNKWVNKQTALFVYVTKVLTFRH
jgi:hypothetical protein